MQYLKSIIKLLKMLDLEAWVTGGTARDIYLGKELISYDISVKAPLKELQEKLADRIVSVNQYTATLIITYKDKEFNISPLKTIKLTNTFPSYRFTNYIEDDINARDFTINSLFYNPVEDTWIDMCNGKQDADNKKIKFINDPFEKILESKIRILRASILPGILGEGWELDYSTHEAIKSSRLKVLGIPSVHIYPEVNKIFTRCAKPSKVFNIWRSTGLLRDFFPEMHYTINIDQSQKNVNLDLYQHILYALDSVTLDLPNAKLIRLAALLHDIGKPQTQVFTESGMHFYDHDRVGSLLTYRILGRWGFKKSIIKKVASLVENHLFNVTASSATRTIKKLIGRVGPENIHDLLDLRIADRFGTGKKNISMYKVETLRKKINTILNTTSPENFKLDLSDDEIQSILREVTEEGLIQKTLPEVKSYLKKKIIIGRLKNKKTNLKKMIKFISNIKCPLDTPHLFNTWANLETGTADLLDDGKLHCGVYCGFNCDKILKKK